MRGITDIADISFNFHIFDPTSWDTIIDSSTIALKTSIADTYNQSYDDSGEVIFDQDNIRIISKGIGDDSILGPFVTLYVENNSSQDITVQVRDTSINGFMVDPSCSIEVTAGRKAVSEITFLSSELDENGIEKITDIETSLEQITLILY